MKKSIEMPIVNVIRYEAKDVITTSGEVVDGVIKQGGIENGEPVHFGSVPSFAEGKNVSSVDPGRLVW